METKTVVVVESLSAEELLTEVFTNLEQSLSGRTINLPKPVKAEIGNDSDYHRTRIGYTRYDAFTLIDVDGKKGIIAFGRKCGHYPADPYNCDIFGGILDSQPENEEALIAKASDMLGNNDYFRSSLIVAMATGELGVAGGIRYEQTVGKKLNEAGTHAFVAQSLRVDDSCLLLSTLTHPVVQTMKYKPAFVAVLVDILKTALQTA